MSKHYRHNRREKAIQSSRAINRYRYRWPLAIPPATETFKISNSITSRTLGRSKV
ncbi:hypothetical protein J6590_067888 [Homalodisca vitripennis]|nr:hypothetical protein J6590_067888 [Homalodisca vitripennis]